MYLLDTNPQYFPHPYAVNEHGILAVGGAITPEILLNAYSNGIFPWNGPDDPLMWWFTFPRMVLYPSQVKVSKSMKKVMTSGIFTITINNNFAEVITACQQIERKDQEGTWLSDSLKTTFITLHEQGYAHSVEVWQDEVLVGGLYGLGIGKIFCGESMFAKVSNASKAALIHWAQHLEAYGFTCIDCQQETDHLASMGAEAIGGGHFLDILRANHFVDRDYLKQCLDLTNSQ